MVDRQSKIVERVPRGEDIDEHMRREVLPFAPDMQWNAADAKLGYETPMTRLFSKPEELPSLEELDAQIAEKLEEIRALFSEVREDE